MGNREVVNKPQLSYEQGEAGGTRVPSARPQGGSMGFDPHKPIQQNIIADDKIVAVIPGQTAGQELESLDEIGGGVDPTNGVNGAIDVPLDLQHDPVEEHYRKIAEERQQEVAPNQEPIHFGPPAENAGSSPNAATLPPNVQPQPQEQVYQQPAPTPISAEAQSLIQLPGAQRPNAPFDPSLLATAMQKVQEEALEKDKVKTAEALKAKVSIEFHTPLGVISASYHEIIFDGYVMVLIWNENDDSGVRFLPNASQEPIAVILNGEQHVVTCPGFSFHRRMTNETHVILLKKSQGNK